MAEDCLHSIALCPDCGGLAANRLIRIPGVTSVTVVGEGGRAFLRTGARVYIGPIDDPCPNPQSAEES